MKTNFNLCFFVMAAAHLIAISAFADGDLVVMDRMYYDGITSSFRYQVRDLERSIAAADVTQQATIGYFQSQYSNMYNALGDIQSDLTSTMSGLDTSDPDQSVAYNYANTAFDKVSTLRASINSDLTTTIPYYSQQLSQSISVLYQELDGVSNSWPMAINFTNATLTVNVLVTNDFAFASNLLCECQHSYTNFLNYYTGIEDELLNQYRATVTNLLDWTHHDGWLSYAYWQNNSQANTWVSGHKMGNFLFGAIPWSNWAYSLNGGAVPIAEWQYFTQYIPSGSSYADSIAFTLQGIHDSAEYGAKSLTQIQAMIISASTNTTMAWSTALPNTYTNQLTNLLRAPDGYEKQVTKIGTTRNYFQRLEHWLSAIAKNTDPPAGVIASQAQEDDWAESVHVLTNDVKNIVVDLQPEFMRIADVTNSFQKAYNVVDTATRAFRHFSSSPNRKGSAFQMQSLSLMDLNGLRENLDSWTGKSTSMDDTLIVRDIEHVSDAWSTTLTAVEWFHVVAGIFWVLLGFVLAVTLCWWNFRVIGNLWWCLIKYIPDVSRFILGN